jgi:LysM repeat protein
MERLKLKPKRRRPVSERVHRLISYAWILASLAVPAMFLAAVVGSEVSPAATTASSHVVSAGESLSAIARRYGVTVEAIIEANGLNDPDLIYAGQVLTIPGRNADGGQTYTVQQGDTVSGIARRYSVPVQDIMMANGLTSADSIAAGQQLVIPASAGEASGPEAGAAGVAEASSATYVLQRGDSLYRLSLIYGVPVDDLLAANSLASPNAIYPGLEIRIPAPGSAALAAAPAEGEAASAEPPASGGGNAHVVQWGETLASIALSYDVTVDGIVAANDLSTPDRIYVGQMLNIPSPGASARTAPARSGTSHQVQAGETLSGIALRYGVTLHSLASANDIADTARIYPGMALSIPSAQAGSNSVRYASVGPGLCADPAVERTGTGYFIRPANGYRITQTFHALHPGIDLAQDAGSPVYAADGGTVVYAGWNPVGYGNLIVLDHGNGWRTYYAHLSVLYVTCETWIARGSTIGEVGSTGNSSGPHLHFEMLRFGLPVDPSGYLRF